MSRMLLVAHREWLESVRTKGFWLGLLILPVLLSAFVLVPALLFERTSARRYGVVDGSGWLDAAVLERAAHQDVKRLLGLVAGRAKTDRLDSLPEALRVLAPLVEQAGEDGRGALAVLLSSHGKSALDRVAARETLGDELASTAGQARDALLDWLNGLGSQEARSLDGQLNASRWIRVEAPDGHEDAQGWFRENLDDGTKLFAFFVIGEDPVKEAKKGHEYFANNVTDAEVRWWYRSLATDEVRDRRLAQEGVAREVVDRIGESVSFESFQLTEEGEEKEVSNQEKALQFAPLVFTYLLWTTILGTSMGLLTNTIEEKSNRTIEVLLSSVSPLQIMGGKIVGMQLVGLTMVGAWFFLFIVIFMVAQLFLPSDKGIDLAAIASDPTLMLAFVAYYLLGYLLYAALLAGLGSLFSNIKDAQNVTGPVMIVMIFPLLTLLPVTQDPNGLLARVLSFVPPFTPFVMMNRTAGPPAAWEYVATTVVLAASVVGAFYLAAKVFRIGVLMAGKPPAWSEVLRWLRSPVGTVPERPQD